MPLDAIGEIRAFLAVADAASFTAAARRLGVTTHAVSLRVRRLEQALGARLFVRTTRSVAMTDDGQTFHGHATRILDEVEAAEGDVRPGAGLRGTLRLAIPGAVATQAFLKRLGRLLAAHPQLKVQLKLSTGTANLAADGLDVALVVGSPPDSTHVGRRLGRVAWVLAATPRYLARHGVPRSPADLATHACLRLLASPRQTEWTLTDRRGREVTVPVGGAFEADDSRALGEAVYAGLGIGIRPARECARAQRAGVLKRVLPRHRFGPLDVYALVPKGHLALPRVAACLGALEAAVAELA